MSGITFGNEIVSALGWTLLHSLWQGVAIALLGAAVLFALRNRSANARYFASWVVLALAPIAVAITFAVLLAPTIMTNAAGELGAVAQWPETAVAMPAHVVDTLASTQSESRFLDACMPYIVMTWAAGVGFGALRLILGMLGIHRLREQVRHAPDRTLQAVVDRLRSMMGIDRAVDVVVSPRHDVPMLVGWIKPMIVVPLGFAANLAPGQVEAILAHELSHVRRHDWIAMMAQRVIEVALFFHPAVHWLSRQVSIERECCCDACAVDYAHDARSYARALADLEASRLAVREGATGGLFTHSLALGADGGCLMKRISRLICAPASATPPLWSALAPAAAFAVLIGLESATAIGAGDDPAAQSAAPAVQPAIAEVVAASEQQAKAKNVAVKVRKQQKQQDAEQKNRAAAYQRALASLERAAAAATNSQDAADESALSSIVARSLIESARQSNVAIDESVADDLAASLLKARDANAQDVAQVQRVNEWLARARAGDQDNAAAMTEWLAAAQDAADASVQRSKDWLDRISVLRNRAETAAAAGKHAEAAVLLDRLRQAHDNRDADSVARYDSALSLLRSAAAGSDYERAAKQQQQQSIAEYMRRAESAYNSGETAKARDLYRRLADEAARSGNADENTLLYRRALERLQKSGSATKDTQDNTVKARDAYRDLVQQLERSGDNEAAAGNLQRALDFYQQAQVEAEVHATDAADARDAYRSLIDASRDVADVYRGDANALRAIERAKKQAAASKAEQEGRRDLSRFYVQQADEAAAARSKDVARVRDAYRAVESQAARDAAKAAESGDYTRAIQQYYNQASKKQAEDVAAQVQAARDRAELDYSMFNKQRAAEAADVAAQVQAARDRAELDLSMFSRQRAAAAREAAEAKAAPQVARKAMSNWAQSGLPNDYTVRKAAPSAAGHVNNGIEIHCETLIINGLELAPADGTGKLQLRTSDGRDVTINIAPDGATTSSLPPGTKIYSATPGNTPARLNQAAPGRIYWSQPQKQGQWMANPPKAPGPIYWQGNAPANAPKPIPGGVTFTPASPIKVKPPKPAKPGVIFQDGVFRTLPPDAVKKGVKQVPPPKPPKVKLNQPPNPLLNIKKRQPIQQQRVAGGLTFSTTKPPPLKLHNTKLKLPPGTTLQKISPPSDECSQAQQKVKTKATAKDKE